MALGDESFTSITGEEISRAVLVQLMIDLFNKKYPDTDITDFNEGSQIRNILESQAVDIFHLERNDQNILRACFLSTSYGRYLDLFGVDLNAPRRLGSYAWGTVTFSIPEPVDYQIEIPYGTILRANDTGLNYVTNLDAVIPIGATSVDCPVYSQVPGENTNAEANTITIFAETKVYNQLSVTNLERCTGGSNAETDDEYRERLLEVKNKDGFGSKDHYKNIGSEVDGVHDIYLTPSETKTGKVIVNGLNKPIPDSVFSQVVSAYVNESNLVYNQSFEVVKTGYTLINLEVTISVTDTISETEFIEVLNALFDSGEYNGVLYRGLNINQDLSKYLIMTALELVPGVLQVTDMTSNESEFSKLTPDEGTVLQLGEVVVTQEIEA